MKHTVGIALVAGTTNTVLEVPANYKVEVTLLFISNLDSTNKKTTVYWEHAHNPAHQIYIINNYPMAANEYLQFSNGSLIMQSGDKFIVVPEAGANQHVLLTFDLYKENSVPFIAD